MKAPTPSIPASRALFHLLAAALLAAALAAAALTGACGGDDGDADGSGTIIPDTTIVLDDDTLAALDSVSADLTTFTFARATPLLDGLAEGDIVVADVRDPLLPAGALRRVDAVDRAGRVTVTTSSASLAEAIERGTIRETVQLRQEDVLAMRMAPGAVPEVGPAGLYFGLNDVVLFDGDGDPDTTGDQVVMNGNIAIEPALALVIDLDGFSLEEASIALTGEVSGNVNIDARREATLPDHVIDLATIELAPITFFVGPVPVVVTSAVDLEVGVTGKVTARMNVGFQTDAEARVGFGYANGSFGPIGEIQPTASVELPAFEDGVVGTARLFAGPRLRVGLYGFDVGSARLAAYVQADVDAAADPWWCLSAGVEGSARLDISIDIDFWIIDIDIDIIDYQTPPIGESVDLGCAAGPAPSSEPGGGADAIQTFARAYGGDNLDSIDAVVPTGDGGALLAGATSSFSPSPSDAWLVKVDALGHVAWQLSYPDLDAATDAIDMGDGYLVTTGRLGATSDTLGLLRVDPNGGVLWARSLPDAQGLGPSRAVRAADGGFLVAGTRGVAAAADFYAARFEADGELRWARSIGGADHDEANAAVSTSDGGFLLVGQTQSFGVSFVATWVVKLDADGAVEWQRLLDTGGNFVGLAAVESSLGGYLVGGHQFSAGVLVRLSPAGAVTWARAYDAGSDDDLLVDAAVYPDGSFALVGSTGLGADADLWAMRVGDAGNVLWSRAIGGADAEAAGGLPPHDRAGQPLAVTDEGGLLVAGRTRSFGAGSEDAWLLALSGNGFVDLDPTSGAAATALSGDVTEVGLPGTPTSVEPEPLRLSSSMIEPGMLSTDATVERQAGLP
ncbi:MAG TPA: hypothetical protein VK698_35440 [Kofleriaceae bacterium]|nr:hypothetical protein [Kofleriaceae bacterium]